MRRLALAAAVLAGLATGCGGGGLQPPPGDHNPDGLDLEVSPRVVRPGRSLQVVVDNRTSDRLEGGVGYGLDRWEGAWRRVNGDMAFIQVLVVVPPHEDYRQRVDVPADAESGIYRVTKDFRTRGERVRLSARFNVAG